MTRKEIILKVLDTKISETAHPDGLPLNTPSERFRAVFRDRRKTGSLQLTQYGYDLLKKAFPYWQIELQADLVVRDHVYLTRAAPSPYFLDGKLLSTFDARFGAMIVLTDGDMKKIQKNHPVRLKKC